jgi:ATP-dependent phosphoenolpyruvate carboxykinase
MGLAIACRSPTRAPSFGPWCRGKLRDIPTHVDPIFGLQIPDLVPEVPQEVLDPRGSWPDPSEYDRQAMKLRRMFEENIHTIGKSASTAG